MNFGAKSSRVAMVEVVSAGDHGYGTLETGAPRKRRGNGSAYLSSAITVTAALAVVALVTLMAQESPQPYAVVLDDPVEDPMSSSSPPGTDLTEEVSDPSGGGASGSGEAGGAGAAEGDSDAPPKAALDADEISRALNQGQDPNDPDWNGFYSWDSKHADGYDPEKQNVLNDEDAFDTPFAGYAPKDLKYSAPTAPETNVLDYLPSGPFSEPKSMELHMLKGPDDPEENVWAVNPLDH